MVKLLAVLVSRLFGPFSVLPLVVMYLLIFSTGLSPSQQIIVGGLVLVCNFILPLVGFFFLYSRGEISDFDITKREERVKWMVAIAALGWVVGVVVIIVPLPSMFKYFYLYGLVVFTVATITTLYYKISMHVTGVTVAMVIYGYLYGFSYWFFLLIVIVSWARFYLKKHTLGQLILGFVFPLLLFLTSKPIMLK